MTPLRVGVAVPLTLDPRPAVAESFGDTVEVRYRPDLLPAQRWPADHAGDPDWTRDAGQDEEFRALLSGCEVMLGAPRDSPGGLRDAVEQNPALSWVQLTAAGAGQQVVRSGLDAAALERITVTSAAGVHGTALAEFAVTGILALAKDLDVLTGMKAAREWRPRWVMRPLAGQHVLVLGAGGIGTAVAELARGLGMTVTTVSRSGPVTLADLDDRLPTADAVVVALPGTQQTAGLLDARRLALLPEHAVVVNVGRGDVVDTAALVDALRHRRLRGAVLDVVDPEPLPADSELWELPNVIISPHTAALTADEDDKIVALFVDNLRRHLAGDPLRNVVDTAAGY